MFILLIDLWSRNGRVHQLKLIAERVMLTDTNDANNAYNANGSH